MKTCTKCQKTQPLSNFSSRGGSQKHLLRSYCNSCKFNSHKNWVMENPDKVKEYRERDPWTLVRRCKRHGITPQQFIDMYHSQGCKCAICSVDIDIVDCAIDHNHATKKVRGVLCKPCNRALGLFKDSPKILKNAMNYLVEKGDYASV